MTKPKSTRPRRPNGDRPEIMPLGSDDRLFRQILATEPKMLAHLVRSVTGLPDDELGEITVIDPHIYPEYHGGKTGILDIRVVLTSKKVANVEMQKEKKAHYRERILSYIAGMVRNQMVSGDDYDKIRRVISITIAGHTLIPEDGAHHHRYTLYDPKTQSEFTDLLEIHTLELPKLPAEDDGSDVWTWMKYLTTDTRKGLKMIAEKKPEFKDITVRLLKASEEETMRLREENIRMYEMDQRVMRRVAMEEGIEKGKKEGIEKVLAYLGMDKEQADKIRKMLEMEEEDSKWKKSSP